MLPKSWNVYREVDAPDKFLASFGLPKIWSEKEKTRIENAVAISVYRREGLKSLNDVVRLENARVADILLSRKSVAVENGIAFEERTRINQHEYISRRICRYENGLGYVISFTATDGTFEQNLPVFKSFVTNVSFEPPEKTPRHLVDRSHYELAREYYKFGPSRAKTVIDHLEQHVAVEKNDDKAFFLLGITHKGIGNYNDALNAFGKAEKIRFGGKPIVSGITMHQAECHFRAGKFQKAHDILHPLWAFYQGNEKQKAKYDSIMLSINEQLNKTEPSK